MKGYKQEFDNIPDWELISMGDPNRERIWNFIEQAITKSNEEVVREVFDKIALSLDMEKPMDIVQVMERIGWIREQYLTQKEKE